jgi:hypothetical protein
MQRPRKKKINRLTPNLLYKPIQEHLTNFENDFYDKPRACPKCKSNNRKKLRIDKKLFCKIITSNGFRDIYVYVQRFQCKDCRKTYIAKAPFYDRMVYSRPIADLILYLSAKNPFNRVEKILLELGIQADRDTVRNYALIFQKKIKQYAGMKIFDKTLGINLLKVMFDVEDVKELKRKYPHKKYDGLADETFPSIKGAKKKFKEINRERKLEGKEPFKYPDGWTLAVSYLAVLKLYASLLLSEVSFNKMFADLLLRGLNGADYTLTDGNPSYSPENHERCLFHKAKNKAKKDKQLKKMKKDKKPPDEIRKYLQQKYKELEEEQLKLLKEKYPKFVEGDCFVGATTTNSIEGGNWRIKYELRTSYSVEESITARAILICLYDSIYTFRNGMPDESFAHKHTDFSFGKIMAC